MATKDQIYEGRLYTQAEVERMRKEAKLTDLDDYTDAELRQELERRERVLNHKAMPMKPNAKSLRVIIVDHTSEMLDNPDEYGIYPTTQFYNNLEQSILQWVSESVIVDYEPRRLDEAYDRALILLYRKQQREILRKEGLKDE